MAHHITSSYRAVESSVQAPGALRVPVRRKAGGGFAVVAIHLMVLRTGEHKVSFYYLSPNPNACMVYASFQGVFCYWTVSLYNSTVGTLGELYNHFRGVPKLRDSWSLSHASLYNVLIFRVFAVCNNRAHETRGIARISSFPKITVIISRG